MVRSSLSRTRTTCSSPEYDSTTGGPALEERGGVFGDLAGGLVQESGDRASGHIAGSIVREAPHCPFGITGKLSLHGGEPLHPPHRRDLRVVSAW